MYDGPIIDAHHHLWDYTKGRHPWLRPKEDSVQALGELAGLRRDFLPGDYVRDVSRFGVTASVHIEALWDDTDPVGESMWLDTLARKDGVAARYVAAAPLDTDGAGEVISRQGEVDRVVGIRAIVSHHPDPAKSWNSDQGLTRRKEWLRDVGLLAEAGLRLDVMMYPDQAGAVRKVAEDFPHLQLIVNHCGSPIDRDESGIRQWREGLEVLAGRPNVALKVSDVAAYLPDWDDDGVVEVIRHCVDTFGAGRCMFGTDHPAVTLKMSIEDFFRTFRKALSIYGDADQRAIMHDNAARIYGF